MVSIDQIKELRERTGISMSACKKALEEAGGDMDAAIDLLRKKGAAKAAERADRATGEGYVATAKDGGKMAMVVLACETDFVARSDEFKAAAEGFAQKVLTEGTEVDLTGAVSDLGIQLGEKIELGEKAILEGETVDAYIHSNGKIGVMVSLTGGGSEEQARDVAMHAAASNPKVLKPEDVEQAMVDKEREIWTEQLAAEGKPAEIMDKIMIGKEKKFREEGALITQPFVKNPDQTVDQYLGDAQVADFVMFRI